MAHAVESQVSARMKLVRRKGTAPEMVVRRLLRELGVRYRTCVDGLPGSPDIANRKQGWAVFVHGCFWHGHAACKLATVPKTNRAFWLTKLAANRERDARKVRALRRLGFRVAVVWQCELKKPAVLERKLAKVVRP